MSSSPSYQSLNNKPSQGIALLLNFFFGTLGVDKFYVGRYDLGILQLILSLTLIGLFISAPWALLCTVSLLIAILYGGLPFMYPGVEWAPLTQTDKKIAWVLFIIIILATIIQSFIKYKKSGSDNSNVVNRSQTYKETYICPFCKYSPCICRRNEERGMGMGMGMGRGCQGCSRGMLGP